MKKNVLMSLIFLFFITGSIFAETKSIKVTIDSIANETELNNNIVEKEISVVEQGFSDLCIQDIFISPAYILGSSSITVKVSVKNMGTETVNNFNLFMIKAEKDDNNNPLIIT